MRHKRLFLSLGFAMLAAMTATRVIAQQPSTGNSASTKDQTGQFVLTSSVEVGVRAVSVEGNADKYRSDLNYQPGIRLFDSSFLLKSDGASGAPFDTLLVNSSGWGSDPTGYARINFEKLNAYRFDAN